MDDVTRTTPAILRTRGAGLLRLPAVSEERGFLVWGQAGTHLPFAPKRFWSICDVPPGEIRGRHSHRSLHELLVCLRGRCCVSLDDGTHRDEVVLDAPNIGLHIAPMTWSSQRHFSADAVLLVLASDSYRPDDRIGDYAQFLELAARRDGAGAVRAGSPLPAPG